MFIFIGARPHTEWLAGVLERDDRGFVLTGPDLTIDGRRPSGWTLERDPWLLEASIPGVFVAGDARAESVKRVASAVGEGAMAVTLVLFQAVYLAEIVRAGIEALPRGQTEASAALGMGYWLRMRKIILPQALYNMLPSMVGQFVTTIKDTSLGYVIGVQELTYAANQVNNAVLTQPFQVFFVLSLVYFVVCFSLTQAARHLEARIEKRRARPSGGAAPEAIAIAAR